MLGQRASSFLKTAQQCIRRKNRCRKMRKSDASWVSSSPAPTHHWIFMKKLFSLLAAALLTSAFVLPAHAVEATVVSALKVARDIPMWKCHETARPNGLWWT